MRNRHGFLPKEADRLLETISEKWNLEIGTAEDHPLHPMTGHSRQHLRAVMASLVNLQRQYSYSDVISTLQYQVARNQLAIVYDHKCKKFKAVLQEQNELLAAVINTFQFLHSNTYNW